MKADCTICGRTTLALNLADGRCRNALLCGGDKAIKAWVADYCADYRARLKRYG